MSELSAKAKPCLIFAVGNESRGDDALGPLILREIGCRLETGELPDRYELIEDFQLQVEHALDMAGRQAVLFIDAGHHTPPPYCFYRAQPQSIAPSSHALLPEALLTVCVQVLQQAPPPSYVLCVSGESFELGEGLSSAAQSHMAVALEFLDKLLAQPAEQWEQG